MEIKGIKLGLTPEDRKIVIGYLKPIAKVYGANAAKKIGGIIGPKVALKVVTSIDARIAETDKEKIKFAVSKAKEILEKPYKEKEEKKQEKKNLKIVKRLEKEKIKKNKKMKKIYLEGKLPFKAKLVANTILRFAN